MKNLKLFSVFLLLSVSSLFAGFEPGQQVGTGTIDLYESHGQMLYRFVPKEPNPEKFRRVKFKPNQGKKPKTYDPKLKAFFEKALQEKKEVVIDCNFADKGAGKKTSIGAKINSYKFVDGTELPEPEKKEEKKKK